MNRQEILQMSETIVNKNGLAALTTSRLAKEFNVKPPSLYKHIKNINEIYDELGIICMKKLIQIIQKNVFGFSGNEALRELARVFRVFGLQNPGLYRSMQLTHVKRSAAYKDVAENLLELLTRVIASCKVKKENYVHAIRTFRCLLHGFIDLQIQEGFGLPEDIDKSFEMAVHGFIESLKKYC